LSQILYDENNQENDVQGKFRVGQFDALAARYAIAACGGTTEFDGLAITCLDRLVELSTWQICDAYRYTGITKERDKFFIEADDKVTDLIVRQNTRDDVQIDHQQKFGLLLRECQPIFSNFKAGDYPGYIKSIQDRLNVPVVVGSFGPTENDKHTFQ
jgi:adenylosuccinate synthase